MNWFTKALASLGTMRHAVQNTGGLWGRLLARTRIDYRKEVGDCLDTSVVTAPVMWIARAMTEARFEVCGKDAKGNRIEREDHPMLALIQQPNAFYGDIALILATAISFAIAGNAYWIILRDGYGQPAALWYVPHWMMEPVAPTDGSAFLVGYRYRPGGGVEPQLFAVEDVVHFRYGIDPRNIRLGLSPLDGVIREIFVDLESSNFVASLLRNMGVPGVVISPEGGAIATPEDVEATKSWFRQAFGGDNRGAPMVMGAPTKVQAFGFNPQQLNLSEGRDVAEERVCACLGIPASVVGFGAGLQQTKVGATMAEQAKQAWTNGVLPIMRMLADELQRSLLSQFSGSEGLRVGIDTEDVVALQEDEDKRSDRALKQFAGGLISFWEARGDIGKEPIGSADYFLQGSTVSVVPIDALGVPPPAPAAVPAIPAAVPALPAPGDPAVKALADGGKGASDAMLRAEAYARALQRAAPAHQRGFEKALTGLFQGFGRQAGDAARALLERDPTLAKALGGEGEEFKADELLVAMILDKLGIPEWQGQLQAAYEAQYLDVAQAVQDAAERAGLGTSLPDVVARSIVAAGGRRAGLVDLADQTKSAVFDALAQGRAAGEGAGALAARISDKVEGGPWSDPKTRARVIARTETKYAQNISTIERAKAAGVTSMVVFDGRLGPGRSTPSHIARNGSIVPIAQAQTMADMEHPNGTLSFAPNFE